MENSNTRYWTQYAEFIEAFAATTNMERNEAKAQWAGFSYGLSDRERENIELGGEQSGQAEGEKFNKCFPTEDKE